MQPKFAQFLCFLGYKAGQNHLFFAAQSRSSALALNSTPASPRKVPEHVQIMAYGRIGQLFHRQFDEGVVVANPHFAIHIAGVKALANNLSRHSIHAVHQCVIGDFVCIVDFAVGL